MKLIPAIDIMAGKVVRLTRGDPDTKIIYRDDPVTVAKEWEAEGADALHVVDLDATLGRGANTGTIMTIGEVVNIPVHAAGGLRTFERCREMLPWASRIVLGTLAFEQPMRLQKLLAETGSERIIVAIDHSQGRTMIDGWQRQGGLSVAHAVAEFRRIGVLYFLLTTIDRDGTLEGLDVETLKAALSGSTARIIASGGAAGLEDIVKAKEAGAFGIVLGKALYEGRINLRAARQMLCEPDGDTVAKM